MSAGRKRPLKGKSSRRECEEKFACHGIKTEGTFYCEQCKSYQCSACDAKLHEFSKFHHHDRNPIEAPPETLLCQMSCEGRNYADVRCHDCELNYCVDCDSKIHAQNRRRSHKRQSYKEYLQNKGQKLSESPDFQSFEDFCLDLSPEDFDETMNNKVIDRQPIPSSSAKLGISKNNELNSIENSLESRYQTIPMPKDDGHVSSGSSHSLEMMPDIATCTLSSTSENSTSINDSQHIYDECSSFLLVNDQEELVVPEEKEFLKKLGADEDTLVKVVSIFGNTGDGKSHSLNHTFFGGREVFKTSSSQESCTVGVWAAFDPLNKTVVIDTEGLLGVTTNQNQRTRLLLKMLAISDVVIYRSKADRLHNDLFYFLSDASKAYVKHFSGELKQASKRRNMDSPLSSLGPAVIIFHETTHTDILGQGTESVASKSPNVIIKERFQKLNRSIDAFCALEYVGTRTRVPPTDFSYLLRSVKQQIQNTSVRAPRSPSVVFGALQVLNGKFSGEIENVVVNTFPDQYFTCTSKCMACGCRCNRTMNHLKDGLCHESDPSARCKYQDQYENKVYICKACYERGVEEIVVPKTSSAKDNTWYGLAKYAWSGYVLECKNCGIIFRSREYWYGNQDPVCTSVRTEIRHVWPGGNPVLQGTHNAARKLLDGVGYMSEAVSSVSAKPTRYLTSWMADQIAPPYWVPNSQIYKCGKCEMQFEDCDTKHHCRACGKGYCDQCSSKRRPVPERGWGETPVRVCEDCYEFKENDVRIPGPDEVQVTARKVGEVVTNTLGFVASAIDYPKEFLKDSARPTYWIPDYEINHCCVCRADFGIKLAIHHCRSCGQGVCQPCSPNLRSVPTRGWDHPVRVCATCDGKKDPL